MVTASYHPICSTSHGGAVATAPSVGRAVSTFSPHVGPSPPAPSLSHSHLCQSQSCPLLYWRGQEVEGGGEGEEGGGRGRKKGGGRGGGEGEEGGRGEGGEGGRGRE